MLIGEAALRSPAFSERLVLLVGDLQAAGYTVWLEGLRLRFDGPRSDCTEHSNEAGTEADCLEALMNRYRDVVAWLPEPRAELEHISVASTPAAQPRPRFAPKPPKTKFQVKPLHKS